MKGLSASEIDRVLTDTLPVGVWEDTSRGEIVEKLTVYLDLLLRWNDVVSLTSVRSPKEIVRRHFAESLFAGWMMPPCENILDLGSGAGFPGVPIQLMRPTIEVVLAEANGRKAAFLRELVRELGIRSRVWARRAEGLQAGSFACVCLRAVDPMHIALAEASRIAGGVVVVLGSPALEGVYAEALGGWELRQRDELSETGATVFVFGR